MSCASYDLKAYQFGEATAVERRAIEQHVRGCAACAGELERLILTQASLMSVRDEDPPRRIAFVSDKVFEPKWYKRPLGPAWGFGSIAALACAIVFHALLDSGNDRHDESHGHPSVAQAYCTSGPSQAAVEAIVKESEQRMRRQLAEAEKRHEFDRAAMVRASTPASTSFRRDTTDLLKVTASADYPGAGR